MHDILYIIVANNRKFFLKKLLFITLLLISCAPNIKYYPYKYDSKNSGDIREILLSELNPIFGIPKELLGKETIADSLIMDFLKSNSYKVNRSNSFPDLIKGIYNPVVVHMIIIQVNCVKIL